MDLDDELSMKKLKKIQSHIRKVHVQNEILSVRKIYENIFKEIEGTDSDYRIIWPSENVPICYPKFVSKKESQLLSKPRASVKIEDNQICMKSFQTIDDFEKINFLELENLKKMSKSDLISVRENVSLEMLWIQQAIQIPEIKEKFGESKDDNQAIESIN
ncbi:hypothetical protein BpHYR1_051588 [Brachionus plicatilis]|uniref:Uncharacterized protein n=1 Tax=Brachionus plicatilis TaxID=10195 RepID=A0A3M7PQ97_BRAPC|nr:hypothetical protein BpHYR1_051588 [Brachionus plicatilis]